VFAADFSNSQSNHLPIVHRDGAVFVEDTPTIERGGEAKFYSRLSIDNNFIDPSNHCDFCNKIEYTPGRDGKAGIAYRTDELDLTGYQRIVFFARGQQGGEVVSFIAIGRSATDPTLSNVGVFPYQRFDITSSNVTLENFWKRYEISLHGIKLEDVPYPFGFVIMSHGLEVKRIFYLKGVTFDPKPARHPLPIINATI